MGALLGQPARSHCQHALHYRAGYAGSAGHAGEVEPGLVVGVVGVDEKLEEVLAGDAGRVLVLAVPSREARPEP